MRVPRAPKTVEPRAAWKKAPALQDRQQARHVPGTGELVITRNPSKKKKGALTLGAQKANGLWIEFNDAGRQRCVSLTFKGTQCLRWGVEGRDRCEEHCGSPAKSSEIRERRFVRYRAGRLAEKTARFMGDPNYKDLTEEIAHLRAQIEHMIEESENEVDDGAVAERMDFLRKMVLTASTIEHDLRANLNIGQAQAFAEQLLAIVLEECADPVVRARVAQRIDGLIVSGSDAALKRALPASGDVE